MAHTFVIFGASGDLTSRKLIPALYRLHQKQRLPDETRIVGDGAGSAAPRHEHVDFGAAMEKVEQRRERRKRRQLQRSVRSGQELAQKDVNISGPITVLSESFFPKQSAKAESESLLGEHTLKELQDGFRDKAGLAEGATHFDMLEWQLDIGVARAGKSDHGLPHGLRDLAAT